MKLCQALYPPSAVCPISPPALYPLASMESIIPPMVTYPEGDHGVDFQYETKVTDVQFRIEGGKKQASSVTVDHKGESRIIDLTENDLLFITNGGCGRAAPSALRTRPQALIPPSSRATVDLWKKIAAQDLLPSAEKFCSQPELSNWESATINTLDDKIPSISMPDLQRDLQRPHSSPAASSRSAIPAGCSADPEPPAETVITQEPACVRVYGLFSDKPGDYVKPMRDCTGREICME